MMKTILLLAAALLSLASTHAAEPEAGHQLYELRTYHAEPGKLDDLLSRFRNHTTGLFKKHGITSVGYWTPVENPDNLLIYLVSYPDPEHRKDAWKAFIQDPDWKAAAAESEKDGKLVGKIDKLLLKPTEFSPAGTVELGKDGTHLCEMRTYTATAGQLQALHTRFRDHTLPLFESHGIANIGYFTPSGKESGEENTLVYFIAHEDAASAKQSWEDFIADPKWVGAKEESEKKAGGSLTIENGIQSVYLEPTDFSPLK